MKAGKLKHRGFSKTISWLVVMAMVAGIFCVFPITAYAADFTTLNSQIATANTLHDSAVEGTRPGQYAQGSRATYAVAIDAAELVAGNAEATQEQIDQAVTDLNTATNTFQAGMVPYADLTDLTNEINAQYSDGAGRSSLIKTESDYTPDSWSDYIAAINDAITCEGNNPLQSEADDALNALNDAIDALILQTDQNAADSVIAAIAALPVPVELVNKDAVISARTAYTDLTANQKALVTNLSVLVNAENRLALLETYYTVTFYLNNGTRTGGGALSQSIQYGHAAVAPTVVHTGYTFTGWDKAFNNVTSNLTVAAKWTINIYTVTFNLNGGTRTGGGALSQTIQYGNAASAPTVVRTGYTFSGWDKSFNNITSNLTVTAQWTISTYKVTYNGHYSTAGTAPADPKSPYSYNSTVTVLGRGTLYKTGYDFICWNTASDASGDFYFEGDTFEITKNTTLYAMWALPCKLIYNGNGNTGGTAPVDPNSPYIFDSLFYVLNPGTLTKTGYTFICWNTKPDGSGMDLYLNKPYYIYGSVTLYAKWKSGTYCNKVPSKVNAGSVVFMAPEAAPKGYTLKSISYASGNNAIGSVTSTGIVTFLKGGKVKITVTMVFGAIGSTKTKIKKITKQITVLQKVSAISLNVTNATLAKKKTLKLKPSVLPASATDKKVKWKSSNSKVASVSSAGVVKANGKGTCIITCTAKDGSGVSASCTITVN